MVPNVGRIHLLHIVIAATISAPEELESTVVQLISGYYTVAPMRRYSFP